MAATLLAKDGNIELTPIIVVDAPIF